MTAMPGGVILALVDALPSDRWQWRKVTGRPDGKPIVDLTGAGIAAALGDAESVATWTLGGIVLTPGKGE